MRRMRRGFTLMELLAVVAVIAILAGIVTGAAAGAIKEGRKRRADAMRVAVEQAIAAYYAQEGQWPSVVERKAESLNTSDGDTYEFSASEADRILQEVVGKGFGKKGTKSMLIDATALFVCNSANANSGRAYGRDFSEATAKNGKRTLSLSQMAFGYADPSSGKFRRFTLTYNARSDAVVVTGYSDK